jgi:malonyl-CoA O-methyltransferase
MSVAINKIAITPAAYAQAAVLAQAINAEMLARLEWVTLQPNIILDVGCGTGQGTQLLQQRYPEAQIIALDNAYPMLQFTKQQASSTVSVCADAAQLPLVSHSVDLIFANLLLPWCADIASVLSEWRRVLRPEGLLMFSSLGPDTLAAWVWLKQNFQGR